MGERHEAYRLSHLRASGAWQMAADRSLLEWCARGSARLVFRTYAWDRPTLSLGRSEPFPGGWDEAALREAGIAVVRRPTGGDAVLHDEELTFAVAASIPGPGNLTPRGFSDRVAEALADALQPFGVPAGRAGVRAGGRGGEWGMRDSPARPGEMPCFARTAPGEVTAGGFKIAGLASRFARAAALCHASVPLTARHRDVARFRANAAGDRAELERHARSVGELLGAVVDADAIADRLAEAVATRFGASLREGDFSIVDVRAAAPVATSAGALAR